MADGTHPPTQEFFPPLPANPSVAWPGDLSPPNARDLRTLSLARKLDICAFYTAGCLGTLRIGTHHGHRAWIITDRAGLGAEARRLDGVVLLRYLLAGPAGGPGDG